MHLFGYLYEDYHDAPSLEHKNDVDLNTGGSEVDAVPPPALLREIREQPSKPQTKETYSVTFRYLFGATQ
jgi:hypothetical protein